MSYKYGVHESENSKPCFNACAFATKEEAERAARELFSRWYAPHSWSIHESDEPVNYEFPGDIGRPRAIR